MKVSDVVITVLMTPALIVCAVVFALIASVVMVPIAVLACVVEVLHE